jgi:hypothetical protein
MARDDSGALRDGPDDVEVLRDGKRVRIVTLTVPTLSLVDALLTESPPR